MLVRQFSYFISGGISHGVLRLVVVRGALEVIGLGVVSAAFGEHNHPSIVGSSAMAVVSVVRLRRRVANNRLLKA
jgi:hypothetical protein